MAKEVFKIKGMHCASCAVNIQKAISKLLGVNKAEVNFGSETALIEYDEQKVAPQNLAKAVSDVGYEMEISGPSFAEATEGKEGKTLLSWKVIGMDSAHCAMTVEQAIKTLAGIEKVEADFNNARAKIIFDPEKVKVNREQRVL